MLNRLVYDERLSSEEIEPYKNITVSTEAAKLGYDKELYFPTELNKRYFTTGEYIRKVEKVIEKDFISDNLHLLCCGALSASGSRWIDQLLIKHQNEYRLLRPKREPKQIAKQLLVWLGTSRGLRNQR